MYLGVFIFLLTIYQPIVLEKKCILNKYVALQTHHEEGLSFTKNTEKKNLGITVQS